MIKLTHEEEVVLCLLAQGFTGKQISAAFSDLPSQRVCKIKKSFNAKLNARNYTHAVYIVSSQKLIKFT